LSCLATALSFACECTVKKELFWGYDMTDMAAAYIKDSQAFEDTEMQRMSDLPIGIERPR